jgi:hypothetical protein
LRRRPLNFGGEAEMLRDESDEAAVTVRAADDSKAIYRDMLETIAGLGEAPKVRARLVFEVAFHVLARVIAAVPSGDVERLLTIVDDDLHDEVVRYILEREKKTATEN